MERAARPLPRSCFSPGQTRLCSLFHPVLLEWKTEPRSGWSRNSGDLAAGNNGRRRALSLLWLAPPPLLSLGLIWTVPLRSNAPNEPVPLRPGRFSKEALCFCELEPAVLCVVLKYVYYFRKRKPALLISKIRFQ